MIFAEAAPLIVEQGGRIQVYRDLITFAGTAFMAVMTYLTIRMNNKQALLVLATTKLNENQVVVAEKVFEVAQQVEVAAFKQEEKSQIAEKKVETLMAVTKSTHTFVNSEKEIFLRKFATIATKLAESSPTIENIQAAKNAQLDLETHQRAQEAVNAQPGTDEQKKGHG